LLRFALALCCLAAAAVAQLQAPETRSRFQRPVICEYDFGMRSPDGGSFRFEDLPLNACNRISVRGLAFSGDINNPIAFKSGSSASDLKRVLQWRESGRHSVKIIATLELDGIPGKVEVISHAKHPHTMSLINDWIVQNGFDGVIVEVSDPDAMRKINNAGQCFTWGIDHYTSFKVNDEYAFNIYRRMISEDLESYIIISGKDSHKIATSFNIELSWSFGGPRFILLTDLVTKNYPRCPAAWGSRDHPSSNTVGAIYTRVLHESMDTIPYIASETRYKKDRRITSDQFSRMVMVGVSVMPTITHASAFHDEYSDVQISVSQPSNMCRMWQSSTNATFSPWSECEVRSCPGCQDAMSTLSLCGWGEKLIYSFPNMYGAYIRDINYDDPTGCSGRPFPQTNRIAKVFNDVSVSVGYCMG